MKTTVGMKIGTGFAAALVILVIIGTISYLSTTTLTDTADWVDHTHIVLEHLKNVLQGLTDAETGQRGYVITADEAYLKPYEDGAAQVDTSLREIKDLVKDNPEREKDLDRLRTMVDARLASLKEVIGLMKAKGYEAAREKILTNSGRNEMEAIRDAIGAMQNDERRLLKERSDAAASSAVNAKLSIVIGTCVAMVILSIAGFAITRNIARPLQSITAIAEQITAGDLHVDVVTSRRQDEIGVLAHAFARMTRSLGETAGIAVKIAHGDLQVQVKPQSEKDVLGNAFAAMVTNLQKLLAQTSDGINILSTSANQISTSTTQLASNSAQTATAVSETTTTVEEVRQTAQLSSHKSRAVSDSAQKVAQISQSGMKSTEEAIAGINRVRQQMAAIAESMVRLSEQSQTIGQIVAAVEDLAAQSNILAVNASIEAAKAGEHGKGFAVVAQEVRSLAEQSKQATNQVRSILTDVQKATGAAVVATDQGSKAVEAGVKQASDAGLSIQTLSSSVAEAAQAATQIAASSQQQLVGVDQVASAMESIKQASTQNVTSAKQLEAAAHDLKELGQRLKETVGRYKV